MPKSRRFGTFFPLSMQRTNAGLQGHDLGDQVGERGDAGGVLAAAEEFAAVHVLA